MPSIVTIRPELLNITAEQFRALHPYIWVIVGAALSLILSVIRIIPSRWSVLGVTLLTTVGAAVCSLNSIGNPSVVLFNQMMISDDYSLFFNLLFLSSAALTVLMSVRYLDQEKLQYPEFNILILFSCLGMMLMTSATDLIGIFIALEMMSLSIYALVGFRRADRKSNEAALKYFILGSAASAILLYGAALLYGVTGTTQLAHVIQILKSSAGAGSLPPLFVLSVGLIVVGFMFKVASVPFHMWMPDVYEGAPSPVTGFMTTGLKAASFATFIRIFISLGYGKNLTPILQDSLHQFLWIVAVLTMVIGNLTALTQANLKRMLAYSSIAHTGYLLVGILAAPASQHGYGPAVTYLVAYSVMNLGAFGVLTVMSGKWDAQLNLSQMSGAAKRHPWLAFAMAVFLFSMAGMPPTAGFAAKYLLFYSAVEAGEVPLVVIAVLCSAVSVYYYLRVLVHMYMKPSAESAASVRVPAGAMLTVAAMAILTLQIGVQPARWVDLAKKVVAGF